MLKVVGNAEAQDGVDGCSLLDEIAREGARRMLVAALETEVAAYLEAPTVRLRQRVTKGAGSRRKALLTAYKLLDMAQARWRRLDGAQLLPLLLAGIAFVDGLQPEGKASKTRARAA
jgi:hypothetical protein